MQYQRMKFCKLFSELGSEEKARAWIWLAKFDGKEFVCPRCSNEICWHHQKNPEVRECKKCHFEVRLRENTIFQHSKIPLLVWLRAICLVTQGKRGVSALELQSDLGMKSYGTTWVLLHKIREALRQRDSTYKLKNTIELDGAVFGKRHTGNQTEVLVLRQRDSTYKLKNTIELDGAVFGKRHTGNQTEVLVAIESKDWIDHKGRRKTHAGFAKVLVARETKEYAQKFVDKAIEKNAMVNTDASPSFIHLENVDVDYQVVGANQEILDHWLPWVHKFISNAKSWIVGTHHGVEARYLNQYLAEYTFRFNRRHDPDSLFFRALGACVHAKPVISQVLFR